MIWGAKVSNPELDRGHLALRLGLAKLGKRVDRRLAFARADDGAVPLVGGVGGIERVPDRAPRAAKAVKHKVLLDRQLQPRAGELALNRQNRREPPTVRQAVELRVAA